MISVRASRLTQLLLLVSVCSCSIPLGFAFVQPTPAAVSTRLFSSTTLVPDGKKVPTRIPDSDLPYGEISRRYRRTHFGHPDWPKHRSDRRFFQNILSIPSSGVVRQLATEVGIVMLITIFLTAWNLFLSAGWDDFSGVHHEPFLYLPALTLPITALTLASPALSLLLVFRTNASYSRWLEARIAWGTIINHTRNTMRTAAGFYYENPQAVDIERVGQAVYSFPRSLMRQLLGPDEDDEAYAKDCREKLRPQIAQELIDCRHKPTRSLHEITRAIAALPMDNLRKVEVDRSVVMLADATGICERIFSTPIPLMYTRHASRFLTMWCLFLPFALWDPFAATWNHYGIFPAALLITFFFFGIEEIAIQLEEPFSILALQSMTNVIEMSCKEYVEWFKEANARRLVGAPMPQMPQPPQPMQGMPWQGIPQQPGQQGMPQPTQGMPQPWQGMPQPAQGMPQPAQGMQQPGQGMPQPAQGMPQPEMEISQEQPKKSLDMGIYADYYKNAGSKS